MSNSSQFPKVLYYYYIDEKAIEGLLSEVDPQSLSSIHREILHVEDTMVGETGSDSIKASARIGPFQFLSNKGLTEETISTEGKAVRETSQILIMETSQSKAFLLESFLDYSNNIYHINKRSQEQFQGWQGVVNDFKSRAQKYRFTDFDDLNKATDNHYTTLVQLHIASFRRLFKDTPSKIIGVDANDFTLEEFENNNSLFRFEGTLRIRVEKLDQFIKLCRVKGEGDIDYLQDTIRKGSPISLELDSVAIIGKYMRWEGDDCLIINPLLIR